MSLFESMARLGGTSYYQYRAVFSTKFSGRSRIENSPTALR